MGRYFETLTSAGFFQDVLMEGGEGNQLFLFFQEAEEGYGAGA